MNVEVKKPLQWFSGQRLSQHFMLQVIKPCFSETVPPAPHINLLFMHQSHISDLCIRAIYERPIKKIRLSVLQAEQI